MASYNRIVLMGNLTRDPQLSYTPANLAVCKFGLAINRKSKDRDGNAREEVCFVDCTLFGRGGEVFNQYMSKGRSVLVEGRLTFDQWTTPEGQKRSRHQVVVDHFTFVGGRGGEGGGPAGTAAAPVQAGAGAAPVQAGAGAAPVQAGAAAPAYDEPPPPSDDGIPF